VRCVEPHRWDELEWRLALHTTHLVEPKAADD
jgi:hypothetical protein